MGCYAKNSGARNFNLTCILNNFYSAFWLNVVKKKYREKKDFFLPLQSRLFKEGNQKLNLRAQNDVTLYLLFLSGKKSEQKSAKLHLNINLHLNKGKC